MSTSRGDSIRSLCDHGVARKPGKCLCGLGRSHCSEVQRMNKSGRTRCQHTIYARANRMKCGLITSPFGLACHMSGVTSAASAKLSWQLALWLTRVRVRSQSEAGQVDDIRLTERMRLVRTSFHLSRYLHASGTSSRSRIYAIVLCK
jgi:hypothetical protein